MAGRFPIYRTKKTLPGQGPNVTGRVTFDTGAGQMAAALGRMGEAMFQVGGQMWEVQASKDFAAATREAEREVNRLSAFVRDNHDLEAIADRKQQAFDYMQNMEIKNGLADRDYQLWLANAMPTIEKGIEAQVRRITIDDWKAELMQKEAQAIDTGNMAAVEAMVRTGQAERILTAEEAKQQLTTTEYEMFMNKTVANPELMLASMKNYKIPGAKYLDVGHGQAIDNIAQGVIQERKRRAESNLSGSYEAVAQMAIDDKPFNEVTSAIDAMSITAEEKIKVKKTYLAAGEVWTDTGFNPYTSTQDYKKLADTVHRIEDPHEVISLQDITDTVYSGKNGSPVISLSHELMLKNMWQERNTPSASGYSRTHPIAKQWIDSIDSIYDVKHRDKWTKEKGHDYMEDRFAAEAILRNNWGNAKAIEQELGPILDNAKDEYVKRTIRSAVWKWLWTERGPIINLKRQEQPLDAVTRADSPYNMSTNAYFPKNEAERLAVPSGSRYFYQGNFYRKN
jgi:hypothetical protein